MPGEVLHILERHALRQEVRHRRHPERMRRQPFRQPGILEPTLDQLADGFAGHRIAGQSLGPPQRREEQRPILGFLRDARYYLA